MGSTTVVVVAQSAYSIGVDMWAVGCVFAEMATGEEVGDGAGDEVFLSQVMGKTPSHHSSFNTKNLQRSKL